MFSLIRQRLIQFWKHFPCSLFEISVSSSFDFCFLDSTESNRVLHSDFINWLNRKKSLGDISGQYGSCGAMFVEFLANNHCIILKHRHNVFFFAKIQWLCNEFCSQAFQVQLKIEHLQQVLLQSKDDFPLLCFQFFRYYLQFLVFIDGQNEVLLWTGYTSEGHFLSIKIDHQMLSLLYFEHEIWLNFFIQRNLM